MQASDSTKLSFYPFRLKKFHNYVCFPLLLALHTLNYFVQFSRCGTGLLETRFKHSIRMLESVLKKRDGGPKWTRTTDLTIISRAL